MEGPALLYHFKQAKSMVNQQLISQKSPCKHSKRPTAVCGVVCRGACFQFESCRSTLSVQLLSVAEAGLQLPGFCWIMGHVKSTTTTWAEICQFLVARRFVTLTGRTSAGEPYLCCAVLLHSPAVVQTQTPLGVLAPQHSNAMAAATASCGYASMLGLSTTADPSIMRHITLLSAALESIEGRAELLTQQLSSTQTELASYKAR